MRQQKLICDKKAFFINLAINLAELGSTKCQESIWFHPTVIPLSSFGQLKYRMFNDSKLDMLAKGLAIDIGMSKMVVAALVKLNDAFLAYSPNDDPREILNDPAWKMVRSLAVSVLDEWYKSNDGLFPEDMEEIMAHGEFKLYL